NTLSYLSLEESDIIAGYYSIKAEADILPVLVTLSGQGRREAFPVVMAKDAPLVLRQWRHDVTLVKGFAGIPEPDETCPLVVPTVLLVPLLGFDAQCNRLGYGAGHYDRTFAQIGRQQGFKAIGIAFDMHKL